MTGGDCPNCGKDQLCSIYAYRRVYKYRRVLRDNQRSVANQITSQGQHIKPEETAYEACQRWVEQEYPGEMKDTHGPPYICANCLKTYEKVPR